MARCGCAAGCSCLVVGSSPVFVSGNGSPGAPFVVGISQDGKTGCAGIAACVAANLGPGLTYDPATGLLQAFVSRDAGNALDFGSDNGLFSSGGGGGGGSSCRLSIDTLPTSKVSGAWAVAGLMNPFNSPYGLEYCIANKIDITHMNVAATADGAMWVAEYNNGLLAMSRSTIYESKHARYLDSAAVKAAVNKPSDENNPYPGSQATGTRQWRSGWYGWLAPDYRQMLVSDALRMADGKTVCLLDCLDAGEVDNLEAENVQAAIRAVRQYCAQDWAFIGVSTIANATTVLNGNCEPMLMVPKPDQWGTTTLPLSPTAVLASGVKWMALSHYYADSVFYAYKDLGVNVLSWGATRHAHRTRSETLGIRGFLGFDPVYTRGPAVYDYRRAVDPWSQRRMGNGQLSHMTDADLVTGTGPRGYMANSPTSGAPFAPEGLYTATRWGDGGGVPSVLCGWVCPLKNATSYTVSVEMMFDQLPVGATGKLGLVFGMPTDENTFLYNGSTGNPQNMPVGVRAGYRVWQRNNGGLGIGIWAPDTGAYTQLTEVTTPAPAADVWSTYLLTVTATTITWRRTLASGTSYTASVTNNVWRGPYLAVEKEELHPENTQYGFAGAFKNLVVSNQG